MVGAEMGAPARSIVLAAAVCRSVPGPLYTFSERALRRVCGVRK